MSSSKHCTIYILKFLTHFLKIFSISSKLRQSPTQIIGIFTSSANFDENFEKYPSFTQAFIPAIEVPFSAKILQISKLFSKSLQPSTKSLQFIFIVKCKFVEFLILRIISTCDKLFSGISTEFL